MTSKFTEADFAAFLSYAGSPPKYAHVHRSRVPTAEDLYRRLHYVELCDSFCTEYFNTWYDNEKWLDFYREFLEWHKEKLNEVES